MERIALGVFERETNKTLLQNRSDQKNDPFKTKMAEFGKSAAERRKAGQT
jgi:hypothetical protein